MADEISHPVFAAIYDPTTWLAERTILRPHREYLVEDLGGQVLDLGAGTGAMFPYFAESIDTNRSADLHAIDPDPHMRKRAQNRADELGLEIDIQSARAEALPYADDSFDIVIASMVFCTIPDVETAVSEVVRVLKPGGEFRFLEHVAADGWQSRLQKAIAPIWRKIAGGCHLTRRTPEMFVRPQSLDVIEIKRLPTGIPPVRPFVRGRLLHRRTGDPG